MLTSASDALFFCEKQWNKGDTRLDHVTDIQSVASRCQRVCARACMGPSLHLEKSTRYNCT
jgi:hypothetical protein